MEDILNNIAANAGLLTPILYGLIVAAGLDTLTGIWAAWKSGTLDFNYVADFVRSHVLQRVTPILLALVAGVAIGGTEVAAGAALIATGAAAGAAYLLQVVASISDNVKDGRAETKGLPQH
jgi:hypothetical protein